MKKIVENYCEMPTAIRKPMWRFWHNLIIKFDKDKSEFFMNYGFASNNGYAKVELLPEHENYRYFIQLYDFVTRLHNFENTSVLEVGSGRGGGAAFLTQYKKPKEYIAMDISQKITDFCNKNHKIPGLKFIKGEAESLPFEDKKFDALINIESARCYNDLSKFFSEVYRVLKDDGKFLFADMMKAEDVERNKDLMLKNGFKIIDETDIRPNVVLALQKNSERNKKAIDNKIAKPFRKSFYEFAGVEGTSRYDAFFSSKMHYRSITMVKA